MLHETTHTLPRIVGIICALVAFGMACQAGPSSTKSASLEDMAGLTPEDARALFIIDVAEIRRDDDLEDLYDELLDGIGEEFEEFDIDLDDAGVLSYAYVEYTSVFLIQGDLDAEGITDELHDREYDDRTYHGVDLWEGSDTWDYFAFPREDRVLLGNEKGAIRDFIRTGQGEADSLLAKAEFKDVVTSLPSGFYSNVGSNCHVGGKEFRGCDAAGVSFAKVEADTVLMTMTMLFGSESRAKREIGDVEDALEEEDHLYDIETTQSGQLVKATARIDLDDFIDVAFPF